MFSKYQDKKVLRSLQKNPNWKLLKFSDVLRDETKNAKKIKKEEYLAQGSYPIIDQGKDYIAGFTNDREGVYDKSPLIIFGDHTRILKYIDFPIFIGADGVKLLKNVFSEEEVLTKYIYYYLRTVNIPDTGYNRHFKFLKEVVIPIPNIYLQKRIVFVLDKAQEFIDKRKAQIEALDQLTQSVFLDMFGDPKTNPKNWDVIPLGELFEIKTGGTPSRENKNYWQNGKIPWVKTTEIKENTILVTEEYITEEGLRNSNAVLLPKNTILIAMYGQGKTRGRTAKLGIEATTNQACAAILPCKEHNPDFIWRQLMMQYQTLRDLGRGGNQPNLNLTLIKQFKIIVPPLSQQNTFAKIIQKIEFQKDLLQKSLVELENNFNSLMQRAFKGELFND